jgi:hypothetical protein
MATPACFATSTHTSRERIARCQHSPRRWPVTVTAEIANRGSVRLRVAVDDDDALAAPGRSQGVRQADDAGADHGNIIGALAGRLRHLVTLHVLVRLADDASCKSSTPVKQSAPSWATQQSCCHADLAVTELQCKSDNAAVVHAQ